MSAFTHVQSLKHGKELWKTRAEAVHPVMAAPSQEIPEVVPPPSPHHYPSFTQRSSLEWVQKEVEQSTFLEEI